MMVALLAWPAAAAEDEATLRAYGRHLFEECTGCHRADGADEGIPSIVGRPVSELKAALEAYRSGERTNPVMVSVAQSLDDRQISALALYLGTLARPKQGETGPRASGGSGRRN